MNDNEMILRNQATIMRAIATLLWRTDSDRPIVHALIVQANTTEMAILPDSEQGFASDRANDADIGEEMRQAEQAWRDRNP
jgi:hypothetical protein